MKKVVTKLNATWMAEGPGGGGEGVDCSLFSLLVLLPSISSFSSSPFSFATFSSSYDVEKL